MSERSQIKRGALRASGQRSDSHTVGFVGREELQSTWERVLGQLGFGWERTLEPTVVFSMKTSGQSSAGAV